MTHFMTGFSLHLKRNQWVSSGATEQHQAHSPLHTLGMGWDNIVPWPVVSPVVSGWLAGGRGLSPPPVLPCPALEFLPLPGVPDEPFFSTFLLSHFFLPAL